MPPQVYGMMGDQQQQAMQYQAYLQQQQAQHAGYPMPAGTMSQQRQ